MGLFGTIDCNLAAFLARVHYYVRGKESDHGEIHRSPTYEQRTAPWPLCALPCFHLGGKNIAKRRRRRSKRASHVINI